MTPTANWGHGDIRAKDAAKDQAWVHGPNTTDLCNVQGL